MNRETILRVLMAYLSAGALLTVVPSSASAQSFDCRKATTAVEKMVCGDADLSMLDLQMARAFTDARKSVDAAAVGQVAWLRDVRNRCVNVDCLTRVHQARIAQLRRLNSAAALSIDRLAGEWRRSGSTRYDPASLTITDATPGGFAFELFASSGAHLGQFEGMAVRNAADAVYQDEETKCEVRFSPGSDYLIVLTSSECSMMGGMGVTFDGEFRKENAKVLIPTLTELGVLDSKVTEKAFSALVGKDYDLFLSSFQISYEEDDLDGLGTKVVRGVVRGLDVFASMEAIVMSRADGTILAAVVDENEDAIKYFSNDSKLKDRLPVTIDKWRAGFADMKVIFASIK
jgi:uncharacterized protein